MEIEIRGHSGCQIDIVNGGDSLFINKSTRDKNYIPRLYKQALKQCNAYKDSLSAYSCTENIWY